MLEEVIIHVNNIEYRIGHIPARQNMALWNKFNAITGGVLPEIFTTLNKDVIDNSWRYVGQAIWVLFQSLYANDPKLEILFELFQQTRREKVLIDKTNFDNFFTGKQDELLEVLWETIKVHFGKQSFFLLAKFNYTGSQNLPNVQM